MKKLICLSLAASLLHVINANGQAAFPTIDSIDINKINASVLVHGDMWWNPTTEIAHCYFPKHSPASINFASSLWMSGYDGANQLHIAAQTYRQNGNDYWPGPLDGSDTLTYATSHNWAKIWKINRTDIQYFQLMPTHDSASTPQNILTWPGRGNTYATGNGGAPLTIPNPMAPFVDLNGNGIYEPLLGEYPDIKGDQALWWVFSDNGPSHGETHGNPLGLEIHAMAYAYNRGTLIDNVVYYDYNIANKSANNYHNFRFGQFDDVDLGYFDDDYIGFDSTHRMGICYNGYPDDGVFAGHPLNSYGTRIPMVGLTMVVLPGDAGASYVPAGSFIYYQNDASVIGNPSSAADYDHYLRAQLRDGSHFTDDFVHRDTASKAYGSGPACNYVYTGDPSDTTQWSECNCNNHPLDRRFIITTGDLNFPSGGVQHIVMALVTTNPDTLNACSGGSFDSIKIVADTAWNDYFHPLPPLPVTGITNTIRTTKINVYPNPAREILIAENQSYEALSGTFIFRNIIGQEMSVPMRNTNGKMEADIHALPSGMYLLQYNDGAARQVFSFIKD